MRKEPKGWFRILGTSRDKEGAVDWANKWKKDGEFKTKVTGNAKTGYRAWAKRAIPFEVAHPPHYTDETETHVYSKHRSSVNANKVAKALRRDGYQAVVGRKVMTNVWIVHSNKPGRKK